MSQPWTALFSITGQAVLEMNLAGVTQSQADHPPAAEASSRISTGPCRSRATGARAARRGR